jgi:hypothetical protein
VTNRREPGSFENGQVLLRLQQHRGSTRGCFTVYPLGSSLGPEDGNASVPRRLAERIVNKPGYTPGNCVELQMCNEFEDANSPLNARNADYPADLATAIEDLTGVRPTVWAPTSLGAPVPSKLDGKVFGIFPDFPVVPTGWSSW